MFEKLDDSDATYHKLFNKITRITNNAKGRNIPDILKTAYEAFNTLKVES